ncbi:hypothetical protein AVEN_84829-1 [Araneus ventricosus]|uniref:Uncharacterized protein n=1 Tax=Araneus ventricosus TaxID=182803 RepID=A0A4Y2IX35_ARAVE|nr:hypothetical protein AVEN_84829-1 [Araneus ventricosus]
MQKETLDDCHQCSEYKRKQEDLQNQLDNVNLELKQCTEQSERKRLKNQNLTNVYQMELNEAKAEIDKGKIEKDRLENEIQTLKQKEQENKRLLEKYTLELEDLKTEIKCFEDERNSYETRLELKYKNIQSIQKPSFKMFLSKRQKHQPVVNIWNRKVGSTPCVKNWKTLKDKIKNWSMSYDPVLRTK